MAIDRRERKTDRRNNSSKYVGQILKGFKIIEYIPAADGHSPKFKAICIKCGREIVRAKTGFLQENSRICCPCSESYCHHGKSYTRLYHIWQNMKRRCYDPNHEMYEFYGGKGISVCDEWLGKDGPGNFIQWALKNGYSDDLTIDRIENDGIYEPSNCRWATPREQNFNRNVTVYATINGESKPLIVWCEEYGIGYSCVRSRIKRGWSVERAVTEPVKKRGSDF